jgi:hypothetical protein
MRLPPTSDAVEHPEQEVGEREARSSDPKRGKVVHGTQARTGGLKAA